MRNQRKSARHHHPLPANRTRKYDAVIIGGGVIGCAIAWHLARPGLRVALLERADIAAGSSGACDGFVFLQSKKPGLHLQLAMQSRQRLARLRDELPVPIEYRECGGMVVIETAAEWAAMQQFVQKQQASGLDVSLLNAEQARRREPGLSEHIMGATFSSLDGQVNPMALTCGLALGARSRGADLITGTAVIGLDTRAGHVAAVETTAGRFATDLVINAAGVHAPEIGAMLGLIIPIQPRRGQLLVTAAGPRRINHCLLSARYIAAKFDPGIATGAGEGISIEQTDEGNFLLGSTREFVGFDRRTTITGLRRIAAATAGILPALQHITVIRAFAGLRPYTPDGLPILGPVPGVPGFIMAAGHEGDGIALAPITGALIAQMITASQTALPLEAFSLSRFAAAASPTETKNV